MSIFQLLLKLFFPSWNFFDRFDTYYELHFFYQNEWRKVDFFSQRKFSAFIFNPLGNYELFLRTQLERFVDRVLAFKEPPSLEALRELSSYQVLQAYLKSMFLDADENGVDSALNTDPKVEARGDGNSCVKREAAQYFPLRIFQCRATNENQLVIETTAGK